MSIENEIPIRQEKTDPIVLSEQELVTLANAKNDDPKKEAIMRDKGIDFDSGEIIVEVYGSRQLMETKKDDFGTIIPRQEVEKMYDQDRIKEIYG